VNEPARSTWPRRALSVARRNAWLPVLLGVALLVAWLRLWSPVPVRTARVERGTIRYEAFGRGTVESQREAAIGFDMIGRLSEVLVEEGARVELGQALARLETEQVKADLRSAQTGIAAARAALQRIAADEARARALLSSAEREVVRTRTLFEAGSLAASQQDEASDRLRVARADLDRVLAQRAEATRGIDVAFGGTEQRRVAMVRTTLLAPFDGLVTRRLREPGDTVTVGTTVLRIADTDHVYVRAALDETVLPRLRLDQPAHIFFPGEGTPHRGRVSSIGWEADRQTHELVVEVAPERLERRVAIGQRADVRIELGRSEGTLHVPSSLVHHDSQGAYLFANRAGKIARVQPRFGQTGDDQVEVIAGLAEGDMVLGSPQPGAALPLGRRWRAQ
jgi:HlyD family secretion protein